MTRFLLGAFLVLLAHNAMAVRAEDLLATCPEDKACTVELPGSQCGDGTQSFVRVTHRKNAKKLFIFLNGGGACWDKVSCGCDDNGICKGGSAVSGLTRPTLSGNWENGSGWRNASDPSNPIAKGYNIIEVPYCTGDIYSGANVANYGTAAKPALVRHEGAKEVRLMFEAAKKMFPSPDKVLFMGCSAGGLGVTFNTFQLKAAYPQTPSYVISDSGLPFKAPHVNGARVTHVLNNWGTATVVPGIDKGADGVLDMSDMLRHNGIKFPDIRFALISAYKDSVMAAFGAALGAPSVPTMVSDTMIDIADHDFTSPDSQKVFYLDGSRHCFNGKSPEDVESMDTNLGEFTRDMLNDDRNWASVRPQ